MNSSKKRKPKSLLGTIIALLIAGVLYVARSQGWIAADTAIEPPPAAAPASLPSEPNAPTTTKGSDGAGVIAEAFRKRQSDVQVEVTGIVKRTLADDLDGSRHQRFILTLSNDQTILVAHNIDLAPKVPLDRGDEVQLYGEYEWSEQGGVLHWTHRDPGNRHAHGWIKHNNKLYE